MEKRDSEGNIIYQTAKGGEYKLDGDGNKMVKKESQGNIVYSDKPFMETVTAVNRLNRYVSAIERGSFRHGFGEIRGCESGLYPAGSVFGPFKFRV